MPRVKGGYTTRRRRKKVLKLAKGYFGSKHLLYKTAHEQVMRSLAYAYRDRKVKKRDFRKLWIQRINAACKLNDYKYSLFINGLINAGVLVNRKMLAELAVNDPAAFTELVNIAKNAKKPAKVEEVKVVLVPATKGKKEEAKPAAPKKEKTVKEAPAKKAAAPKTEVKKEEVKTTPVVEETKKAPAKKAAAKKEETPVVEEAPKKAPAKKAVAKKEETVATEETPKKAPAKKAAAKKEETTTEAAPKKAPAKKAAAKKEETSEEVVKKAPAKKAAAPKKEAAPKKAAAPKEDAAPINVAIDINALTIPGLKALCKQYGLTGYSTMKKGELIELLAKHLPSTN